VWWMISGKPSKMSWNRKTNTCTRCGRPSRGHVGPQGARCSMLLEDVPSRTQRRPASLPDFENLSVHSGDGARFGGDDGARYGGGDGFGGGSEAVLRELSNQFGIMSMNMQRMQEDLSEVKAKTSGQMAGGDGLSGNRPCMTVADMHAASASKAAAEEFICQPSGAKITRSSLRVMVSSSTYLTSHLV
jgi:hypothetical protein